MIFLSGVTFPSWPCKFDNPNDNISLTETMTKLTVAWKSNQKQLLDLLFRPKTFKMIFK